MSVNNYNPRIYSHGDSAQGIVSYFLPPQGEGERAETAIDHTQLSNFPASNMFAPPGSSQNQRLSSTHAAQMHQLHIPPPAQTQNTFSVPTQPQNAINPMCGPSPHRQFTSASVYSPQVGQFASPPVPSPQRNFSIPPMPVQNMQYQPGLAPHSNYLMSPVTLSLQANPSMLQSVQSPAGLPLQNGPPTLNIRQSTVLSPTVLATSPITYTVSPSGHPSTTSSTAKYSPNSNGYGSSGQNVIVVPSPLLGAFASPDANYVTPSPSTNPGTPFVPVSQIDDVLKKARMPYQADYPAGIYAPNSNQLSTGSVSSLARRDSNSSSLSGPVLLGRYGSLSRHRVNSAEHQPYHSASSPAQPSISSPHVSVQINYPLPFNQPSIGSVDGVGTEAAENDVSKLLEAFSFSPASFAGDERGSDILTKGYTFEDTVPPIGFDPMPPSSQWQPLSLPSHQQRQQVSPSAGGYQQPIIIQSTTPPGDDISPSGHMRSNSHQSAPSPITIITTTELPSEKAYVSTPRERVQRLSPNSPNTKGFTQLPVAPQPPPTIIRSGGTKYYQCSWPECGKTFTRPYNLKSHYLSHTGEKPFLCDMCHLSFSRKHDLKRHFKLHQGLKPFQCPSCFKSFARSDALRRHLKTTDPDKVSMCALRIGVMTMQQDELEAMDPVDGLDGIDDGALDSIVGVVSIGNEEGRYR